ncbi:hypothetical protein GUJ93_ZPchr0007g3882 [Zizania palustris]|uniref:DNA polymerase III gamma subunit domain-containing protein n=1 Tax=Zizania palustris TaxID=103762 RepID=A0A8J5W5B2_ZIZPA|nr:hypothetical protein GUJ93_ZPchr0007g3882 [Zizania palustris]
MPAPDRAGAGAGAAATGGSGGHLRGHAHLTTCIHLRHHRGKFNLDLAGRRLACGISDPKPAAGRKSETAAASRGHLNGPHSLFPVESERNGCEGFDTSPLLIEVAASGARNGGIAGSYSGELGIFSDQSSEMDSDPMSEARSGHKSRGSLHSRGRHRSLTQKFAPKTFKGVVGQSLVMQALSNAVLRRKIGLVYVFYGPHGTGKTSCARVFAKALNCHSVEHPRPCDACTSCIAHNLGKSRSVMEIGPVGNIDMDDIVADTWSVLSKVVDRAPRRVVFILVSPNLDLPHIILSRCQKFFFPKLKECDIVNTLQWISTCERFDVDRDALKLIASRSDGSLRDAEMTLDQLSLLGQRISSSLVQELVGLVSDDILVDLLDLALSAHTVNTVETLRDITETGVEPLALISQLATIITDILAGSYTFTRERLRRKFFKRPTLSKGDMEKLRQALKTLSESEKQLRLSNDQTTWLTAALLQLAPDKHVPKANEKSRNSKIENEMIWQAVVESIQSDKLRKMMAKEGRLSSISLGITPTVQKNRIGDWSLDQGVYFVGEFQGLDGSSLPCESGLEGHQPYQGSSCAEGAFQQNLREKRYCLTRKRMTEMP